MKFLDSDRFFSCACGTKKELIHAGCGLTLEGRSSDAKQKSPLSFKNRLSAWPSTLDNKGHYLGKVTDSEVVK
jgi:hypothetical protein